MPYDMAQLVDVFFNGRPATKPPTVTIEELIKRGTSHVLVNCQLYRVEATEVEPQRKA